MLSTFQVGNRFLNFKSKQLWETDSLPVRPLSHSLKLEHSVIGWIQISILKSCCIIVFCSVELGFVASEWSILLWFTPMVGVIDTMLAKVASYSSSLLSILILWYMTCKLVSHRYVISFNSKIFVFYPHQQCIVYHIGCCNVGKERFNFGFKPSLHDYILRNWWLQSKHM